MNFFSFCPFTRTAINAETGKCFSDIFFLVFRLLCNLNVQFCFLLFLNFSVFLHVSLLNQQDTDIFSWPYGLETALPCKEICQISRIFCGKIENMSKWLLLIFLCIFLQACECFFFSLQGKSAVYDLGKVICGVDFFHTKLLFFLIVPADLVMHPFLRQIFGNGDQFFHQFCLI